MSALLISPTLGQRSVFIVSYQTALSNNLTQNTMRLGRNNISIKVTQQAFNFVVQCTTPENKRDLQDFLTAVMRATMKGGNSLNPTRLLWASQGLDYLGYIMTNQLGVQKFEVGPHLTFSMQLAKDELNTITNDFSTGGTYTGIYDGQVYTEDDFTPPSADNGQHGPGSNRGD
jgi:predicted amino acid-binding ACT domain protein